jgi:tetratricopeptide (TPR) repeat protein
VGAASTSTKIGEVNLKLNNYRTAEKSFLRSMSYAKKESLSNIYLPNCLDLADLYFETGRYKDAYSYLKEYYTLKDSIFSKENQMALDELQLQYETEKKENENEQLRKENEIKNLRISKQRYVIGTVILITLIIVLVMGFIIKKLLKK